MPLTDGQTFAGYTILRRLGSGGMGEVYLAEHPRLPRRDALKVLPADVSADPDYRARFIREADLASKLWHPHIVSVHDRGEYNNQLWISMDYVEGLDAHRLLGEHYPDGMPLDQVGRIVVAVASALDYAHKQGLLHRDVKPANIMLTHLDDAENEQRILLTDFGIARSVDDLSGLTATNMTVGTVAYSAPEQLIGKEVDGRADQYALAATAYHLLVGKQLFSHPNPAVVISRHLNQVPPALANSRPELASYDFPLTRALAKDPGERFDRCSDFAGAMVEQAPQETRPSRARTQPHKLTSSVSSGVLGDSVDTTSPSSPKRRWIVIAAIGAAIVLAGAAVLTWRPWEGGRQSPAGTTKPAATPAIPASGSSTPGALPVSPTPAIFPAKAIDSVLLTAQEVNSILGTFAMSGNNRIGVMKVDRSTYGLADNSNLVKPPSCVGVVFGAEHSVYADTGFDAVRDQTFTRETYVHNATGSPPLTLEQTVIVFPSADQAKSVVTSAQNQWRACTFGEVDQKTGPESGYGWNLSEVQRQGDFLTLKMASNGAMTGAAACQQVLGVRENVIVDTRSCDDVSQSAPGYDSVRNVWPTDPRWATDEAFRLANAMLAKIKR